MGVEFISHQRSSQERDEVLGTNVEAFVVEPKREAELPRKSEYDEIEGATPCF
jgi:hypothetical protein